MLIAVSQWSCGDSPTSSKGPGRLVVEPVYGKDKTAKAKPAKAKPAKAKTARAKNNKTKTTKATKAKAKSKVGSKTKKVEEYTTVNDILDKLSRNNYDRKCLTENEIKILDSQSNV